MTESNGSDPDALPVSVTASQAFTKRLPNQRLLDLLARIEPVGFGEIAQSQPFRLIAFRALIRDYPDRDPTSLWLHSYDCEVDIVEDDPFDASSPVTSPLSVITGTAGP